jgi:hypothetical protein
MYIVPLSLVVLALISLNYTFGHETDYVGENNLVPSSFKGLLIELSAVFLFSLITLFFTRLIRILALGIGLLLSISIFFAFYINYIFNVLTGLNLLQSLPNLLFQIIGLFLYLSLGFSFGNFSLILIYGNNVKQKTVKKTSVIVTAIAFATYGLYNDLLWFLTLFFPRPEEKAFILIDLGIWKFPYFYFIIFFFIGLIVGKYKQRSSSS